MRDARISMLYEGTTGIQALDLLGRKVLGTQGKMLEPLLKRISDFCNENESNESVSSFVEVLREALVEWEALTRSIGTRAMTNPDEVGAASVDYMMFSGYITLAYLWARAAVVAGQKLAEGGPDSNFYRAKVQTAEFYYAKILPRTRGLVATIGAGSESLMAMDEADFLIE